MTNGSDTTDELKRAIERRYQAICAAIEADAETGEKDSQLRDEIAELSALMIAYTDLTGGREAISDALGKQGETEGRDRSRLSLADRALKIMDQLHRN
ncbi:hypothetical protein [Martelella mediterranea]|uniref:Uncharacterized protein n=1 Tax=Martelella mediterranea TaxID=293089 RepID=A0A4V2V4Z6_9HYPH|nr:hypothetical protein [Martelella mediterranea]TCT45071.1 hypothetical protein EDC90_1001212 [Martelella mediterranea]